MTFGQLLSTFFHDDKVGIALLLVALDLILGILAAFKLGTFRLSYVADFLRNDVAFKLVPYFILYVAAIVAGQESFLIDGLDIGLVAGGTYGVLVLAWTGSILGSLRQLGLAGGDLSVREVLAGAENAAPPKD